MAPKKGKKNANPCLRCPSRLEADYCTATKDDNLLRCNFKAEQGTSELWRGFAEDVNFDPTASFSNSLECQAALNTAASVDAKARHQVKSGEQAESVQSSDDDFEKAVDQKKLENMPMHSSGVVLSKQLLEYAFDQVKEVERAAAAEKKARAKKKATDSAAQQEGSTSKVEASFGGLNINDGIRSPESSGGDKVKVDTADDPSNATDVPLVLCHRCPTQELALENASHVSDLDACMKIHPRSAYGDSGLWWYYQDDPSGPNPADAVPKLEHARDLLQDIQAANKGFIKEAQIKHPRDLQAQLNYIGLCRFQHEWAGMPLTKQMLEFAAQYVYPQDPEQELEKANSSHPTTSAGDQSPSAEDSHQQAASGDPTGWGSSSLGPQGKASTRDRLAPQQLSQSNNAGAPRPQTSSIGAGASSGVVSGIVTNHFKIKIAAGKKLYGYQIVGLQDQELKRTAPKKRVLLSRFIENSEILKNNKNSFAVNNEGRIIAWKPLTSTLKHDAAIELLDINDFNRERNINEADRSIPLDLVYKGEINLADFSRYAAGQNPNYQETGTAQALDILIGKGVQNKAEKVYQIGDNKFFPANAAKGDLGGYGLVAIRGYSSHVKAGNGSLVLNVNTAFSAFYVNQPVSQYLKIIPQAKDKKSHLVGVRVRIMYDRCKPDEEDKSMDSEQRRIKTITDVSDELADELIFQDRLGNEVSVWQHFVDNYQSTAERKSSPKQFCINTGSTTKGKECWYLPDQLDVVAGQVYRKTLDNATPKMTEEMIKFACVSPEKNRTAIQNEGLAALGLQKGTKEPAVLQGSGISVERTMMNVQSRVIGSPIIKYRKDNVQGKGFPKPASWTTRNHIFINTQRAVGNVIFVHSGTGKPQKADKYMDDFGKVLQWNGLIVQKRQIAWGGHVNEIGRIIQQQRPDVVVLVAQEKGSLTRHPYAQFRSNMDQIYGKSSLVLNAECMNSQTDKNNPHQLNLVPYMANNAMKVNLRLGNENHTIEGGFKSLMSNGKCDTLVLGADLIHPKHSSAKFTPSIAALVGSVDGNFATFLGSARYQKKGDEYVDQQNMFSMATERIQAWKKKNNNKDPSRILYYRDGTGKTQYGDIRTFEVAQIKKAWECVNTDPKAILRMTTVMVVKRHTTRFYPQERNYTTKTGNCFPGTVVDRGITSPNEFDFFLQSHDVEKRDTAAKPTHYFILENGMDFGEQDLQNLTNEFCYIYAHSTNAVSYAAPAYYADKLCERTSLYLREAYDNDNGGSIKDLSEEQMKQKIKAAWTKTNADGQNPWHKNLADKMFWM